MAICSKITNFELKQLPGAQGQAVARNQTYLQRRFMSSQHVEATRTCANQGKKKIFSRNTVFFSWRFAHAPF
jgi:hypothetical protein